MPSTSSKKSPKLCCWLALLVSAAVLFPASAASQDDLEAADKRIFQEIREHNQIMENLEYLSDRIGPRLTGSEQLEKAVAWASDLARRYGFENVHTESWTVAHSWQRGSAEARIVAPIVRNLTIASAGWSPGTAGKVRGKVLHVPATNRTDLQAYAGKLRGALVVLEHPADLSWQASSSSDSPGSPIQAPEPPPNRSKLTPEAEFDRTRMMFFKDQGVAAVLRDSDKSYGLLNMTNAGDHYEASLVPVALLTHEDYGLVWRMLQKGPVEVEISLSNAFGESPVESYNTVAEIAGSERPDEVVIICAHLDSWDLASGSTDDGTGVASVMEAGRAIKALGLQPKRTIRIVLFSGEEQGLVGSREYVRRHEAELGKISAVLADDTGTGRLSTVRLNQNFAAHKLVDTVLAPMRELNLIEPGMERFYGSDYASFNDVGVPGFACVGTQSDYYRTHHSQADTFDKVQEDGVTQAAELLAGWAYNTAQLPELLPRN